MRVVEVVGVGNIAVQFTVEKLAKFIAGGAVIAADCVAGRQAPLVTATVIDAVKVVGEGDTAPPTHSTESSVVIDKIDELETVRWVGIGRGNRRNQIDKIIISVVECFEQVGILRPRYVADAAVDQTDVADAGIAGQCSVSVERERGGAKYYA